jgi:hypothetical protein
MGREVNLNLVISRDVSEPSQELKLALVRVSQKRGEIRYRLFLTKHLLCHRSKLMFAMLENK